ncbi:DUF885 domain-containing protein [Thalassotalea ponticola]|uniref:DUF885 domain-containing protein n=1 Tax=Thalassotalea ponticola TaxID=1523392 RepID=UPI0025B613B4|nr:DUF885 domain-containing protein [Thalassotalea ponticola]MDN3652015.1 DUF885 domain-containing protein [Thalassotalea ponticola]
MKPFLTTCFATSLVFSLSACGPQAPSQSLASTASVSEAEPTTSPVQAADSQSQLLKQLFEDYFNDSLALNPLYAVYVGDYRYNDKFNQPISEQSIAEQRDLERRYLDKISNIDKSQLSGQDLLSYQIFERDRQLALKDFQFDGYMMPLNQMHGIHNTFAALGSGESAQPFATVKDYQDFIKRADGFAAYMDSAIVAMQQGMDKSVVLPKALVLKIIPQMKAHIVSDVSESVFWGPVKQLADKPFSDAEKQNLRQAYQQMIEQTLVPVFTRFADFLENSYLPAARDSVGLSALPNGEAWYQHQIEINTTLPLSAEEIHQYGQREVTRILAEMKKVKQSVGFEGDLTAFFDFLQNDPQFYWQTEQQVIDAYESVKAKIDARLPQLFEIYPKADYIVKPVEAFRAASSAGASYQAPAPDGSRPGIFYINTYNLKAQPKFLLETLSIHEASPGHHFQVTIQQEVDDLPKFRKYGGYTAYVEGWALYAESLGKEMGMFTDPYQWYGRLVDEQLRAMRLVVDTGLHAFGWSRQQAIDFMAQNSSMALSDITSEVERYIAIPGQALAYKIGQRAIRDLRNKAQDELGEDFDVRKFHTQILIDGALPMPVLASKIDAWIAAQKQP